MNYKYHVNYNLTYRYENDDYCYGPGNDCSENYNYQYIDSVNIEYVYRLDNSFFKKKYKVDSLIDIYCLERIYKLNGIYNVENFECSVKPDYYGDEVDVVSFNNQSKIDSDVQSFLKLKTNKQKIEYVLMKEYNYILPEINDKKSWIVKSIPVKNIIFSNLNHFNNLNNDLVNFYHKNNYKYPPVCICLKDGNNYKIIDGYHRFKAVSTNSRKINVIC